CLNAEQTFGMLWYSEGLSPFIFFLLNACTNNWHLSLSLSLDSVGDVEDCPTIYSFFISLTVTLPLTVSLTLTAMFAIGCDSNSSVCDVCDRVRLLAISTASSSVISLFVNLAYKSKCQRFKLPIIPLLLLFSF